MSEELRLVLGSQSASKLECSRQACELLQIPNFKIVGFEVESGVTQQPMDRDTMFAGAQNRAVHALAEDNDADFGIGIEGGLFKENGRWFNSGIVIAQSASGDKGIGETLRLEVPHKLIDLVMGGMELADAIHNTYDKTLVARDCFSTLSASAISRIDTHRDAVVAALVPLLKPEIYT